MGISGYVNDFAVGELFLASAATAELCALAALRTDLPYAGGGVEEPTHAIETDWDEQTVLVRVRARCAAALRRREHGWRHVTLHVSHRVSRRTLLATCHVAECTVYGE